MAQAQQSDWYPIRPGNDRTEAGLALLAAREQLCTGFAAVDGHRRTMIETRIEPNNYAPVARKYGFVDVETGKRSPPR